MEQKHYIIRGGLEGRARLVVLSRIMRPTILSLLDRAGIRPGMNCLEIGRGSGDIAFELARIVGPEGKVVATDIAEIDQLVHELYEFAHDPNTIISGPRVIQTWGHRP